MNNLTREELAVAPAAIQRARVQHALDSQALKAITRIRFKSLTLSGESLFNVFFDFLPCI